jgi:hypothetical protein
MSHQWDEFSKTLAEESLPRRESLRRLGAVFAGAILAPLGMHPATASSKGSCKTLCNQCPKWARNQCLAACQACGGDGSRLCGSCGSVACCGPGEACCDGYCADLASDINNCGSCGDACDPPGPYEYGACINGNCEYECADGAVRCGETCTYLTWDPDNCGACGNVCGGDFPHCNDGVCSECSYGQSKCNGVCVDLDFDSNNCGACGNVCSGSTPYCIDGTCSECGGLALCDGRCVDLLWDNANCGACGVACPEDTFCHFGYCDGQFDNDPFLQ